MATDNFTLEQHLDDVWAEAWPVVTLVLDLS